MATATELLNAYLNKVNRTDDAQVIEDLERERNYLQWQVERLGRSISELETENIRLAEALQSALDISVPWVRQPRS